jgi:hypothetical protein
MGSNLPLKPINCIVTFAYQKFELIFGVVVGQEIL